MPSTWMTYEELAVARGIAVKSAKTLARRPPFPLNLKP